MTAPATTMDLASLLSDTARRAVVIGVSKDPNAKLTAVLVPEDGRTTDTLVAKIATTPAADDAVLREHARMCAIRPALKPSIAVTVPEPLGVFEVAGRMAMLSTGLPGVPLLISYQKRRHTARPATVQADFAAVGQWLAAFQQADPVVDEAAPVGGGLTGRRLVAEAAARFADRPWCDELAGALEAAVDRLAERAPAPRVVHGDLWAGNLLLTSRTVTGVVDWEASELDGDPQRDIVRFALAYALYLDRRTAADRPVAGHDGLRAGRWGAGIRYAVDGRGWFPELFREFVSGGLDRLGQSGALWRDAVLLGLADVAVTADHDGFARDHGALAVELARGRGAR